MALRALKSDKMIGGEGITPGVFVYGYETAGCRSVPVVFVHLFRAGTIGTGDLQPPHLPGAWCQLSADMELESVEWRSQSDDALSVGSLPAPLQRQHDPIHVAFRGGLVSSQGKGLASESRDRQ